MNGITEDELSEIVKEGIQRYGITLNKLSDLTKKKINSLTKTELTNLNTYFIDLQNKYILTPSEEGIWEKIRYKLWIS